jgi:uncharacterized protein YqgC (DUF456 family)
MQSTLENYDKQRMSMLFALVAITMLVGLVGLVGVVAPFVPGLVVVWLAALAYGLFGDFQAVGAVCFAIITMLLVIGETLGYVLPGRAAGKAGAPTGSIAIGALGDRQLNNAPPTLQP